MQLGRKQKRLLFLEIVAPSRAPGAKYHPSIVALISFSNGMFVEVLCYSTICGNVRRLGILEHIHFIHLRHSISLANIALSDTWDYNPPNQHLKLFDYIRVDLLNILKLLTNVIAY